MVKNPPAHAGDMGPIPGPGEFRMPRLCTATTEPGALVPMLRNKRNHSNEKHCSRVVPTHRD